ncbi:MAG: ferredoxin:protochlorophyllide reductase (ATP-dependent) iron-sulfur ATP-binding protein [Chlorobium sp.]|jgi:light-independent protochlorophyllide reductase subunit L|nr:MAG: ferredoxin:protochlorophyllide reductase (ATP-dependent) iron-sulfur ATP-binding protein [Chlorobium sp.]
MSLVLAVYGKGGIGKSTTSANISAALALKGAKVLQIGCDPKHDSTFPITGKLQKTVIEALEEVDFHHEELSPEDIIEKGFAGIDGLEAGGPPAGSGCGGYVVGEAVALLQEFGLYDKYDVILFDVLGDVVCGGFSAPLNYADYAIIIATNDFDSIFAANRLCMAIQQKSARYKVKLAGIVANRVDYAKGGGTNMLDQFAEKVGTRLLSKVPYHELIRQSRFAGKTLFAMDDSEPGKEECLKPYNEIAEDILSKDTKSSVPVPIGDREIFEIVGGWQ